jgi:FHS family Na+ dependent glucose MFS transporter 1
MDRPGANTDYESKHADLDVSELPPKGAYAHGSPLGTPAGDVDLDMPTTTLSVEEATAEVRIAEYLGSIDIENDRIFLRAVTTEIVRNYWDVLLAYILSYSTMGVALSMVGPTMLVLGRQVGTTSTSSLSLTYTGRAIGFFIGSIVGGQVGDRLGPRRSQMLLCVTIVISGLITLLFPVAKSLVALVFIAGLSTLWMGALDNLSQVLLVRVCGRYGEPMMQALHAGFAVGSFIAPFVISFFLTEVEPKDEPLVSTFYKSAFYAMTGYMLFIACVVSYLTYKKRGPFGPLVFIVQNSERAAAAAALGLSPSEVAPFAPGSRNASACITPFTAVVGEPLPAGFTPPEDPSATAAAAAAIAEEETGAGSLNALRGSAPGAASPASATAAAATAAPPPRGKLAECLSFDWVIRRERFHGSGGLLLCVMALLLFFYVGAETGFGHYIAPYANERNFYDDTGASFLASVFWGCFALGRLSGIPFAMYFEPRVIATFNIVATTFVIMVMSIWNDSIGILWLGTALLGYCMASLYAACVMWLDSYIELSGSVLSVIVVAVSLSEALVPMACGASFDLSAGPVSMLYLLTALLVTCTCFFGLITVYLKRTSSPKGAAHAAAAAAAASAGTSAAVSGVELSDLSPGAARRGAYATQLDDDV